ncbi:multidrug effflux MFS transporter [Bowmanella denitrificans]|uniref:multidrug effflux MFS transporter n=1 Tax=Bowmanella denitrificans TaxID=366582 RepID=UPI000C9CDD8D|nr:multidrug effflux MFS transporter [Bowmanella denitrificans]
MHTNTTKTAGWIILLLASITAVTPLAIDMYLPAFGVIAQSLNSDIALVQVSLSTYLAGFALSMLVCGPIADIVGRRPLALIGLGGFCAASIALCFTSSMEMFWVLRTLQAMAGGAAAVVVPGIVRHIYGENTAKGMSYVSMIMMIAPLVAPSIGSLIMHWFDWRAIFAALAVYAVLLLLPSFKWLPEVATRQRSGSWGRLFFASYVEVLGNRKAQPYIATSMFASFAFFAYLTAVPVVYMDVFGVSKEMFGILFAANVIALIGGNFVNSRLVGRLGTKTMLISALSLALVSALSLVTVNMLGLGLYATVACILPLMAGLSLTAVNSDALILIAFPHHTGTATAVIGTLRFGSGALTGPLLAVFHDGTALPFAVLMLGAVMAAGLVQTLSTLRGRRSQQIQAA